MPIKFTLQDTMDRHGITQYALHKTTGVRMNTIQDIREGNVKALTVDKLDAIVAGLSHLSGQTYGFEAVMTYSDDPEWQPVEIVGRNRSVKEWRKVPKDSE